jgi:membrane fusion protein (multidrug efflux system)
MAAIEREQTATAAPEPAIRPGVGRRLRWPLMIAAPVLVLAAAAYVYLTGGRYQSTDDAYVQAARVAISANVPGRVVELLVHENEQVKAGQVLFRLDPRDYQTAVASARAQLEQAQTQVRSLQATYGPREAELQAATADLAYREKELARQRQLTTSGVGSQRDLDQRANDVVDARSRIETARTNLTQALATIGGPVNGAVDSYAAVKAARATLDRALLNLSYTVVAAPQDGLVTRVDQLQVGSYITAAQPLFTLVAPRMWIDANFKENQLAYMRVGQHGEARIDAYPGQVFPVHVDSLSPGTGSAFAILPAENATGNWIKVTQRLPVRIAFDNADAVADRLHAGLSARIKIDTEHHRTFGGGAPPPAAKPGSTP